MQTEEKSTWYEVKKYGYKATPVTVVGETPKQITIEILSYNQKFVERKRAKESQWCIYFPTELEALQYLEARTQRKYDRARSDMEEAGSNLRGIKEKIFKLL